MTLHLIKSMDCANGSQFSSEYQNSTAKRKHGHILCKIEVEKQKLWQRNHGKIELVLVMQSLVQFSPSTI